ncbi:tetratricopeptide repeat protein [Segetibacter aerophilus]|uniref:Uncharacterized protein n=1 Tax=Segetibacter aerophilus TaxID=670293 RepID=A0A512BGZ1_9BACT|nr:tetratricopeptide repeat protein [Segetibacter aerophilus]GEO11229.1 hypothetical protein SAE01_37250 [Segetibacter aerophilus]
MIKYLLLIQLLFIQQFLLAQNAKRNLKNTEKTSSEKYDTLLSKAELALENQELNKAKEYYKKALELRPGNTFPNQMIISIENSIATIAVNKKRDRDLARKAEINRALDSAGRAMDEGKWDASREIYLYVLSLSPVKSIEDFANHRINALNTSLGTPGLLRGANTSSVTETPTKQLEATRQTASAMEKNSLPDALIEGEAENTDKTINQELTKKSKTKKINMQVGNAYKYQDLSKTKSRTGQEKNRNASIKVSSAPTGSTKSLDNPSTPVGIPEKPNGSFKTGSVKQKNVDKGKGNNYGFLMNEALKAINLKKYVTARALFQQILTLNSPNVEKNSIRSVIRSIDEVLAKEGKH